MGKHLALRWGKPIPALTFDEMYFAMICGTAAPHGRMPFNQVDISSGPGRVLVASDDGLLGRAATFAILDSLNHDPDKAGAALYRYMMIAIWVLADDRTDAWLRVRRDEGKDVYPALIEAIATIPTKFGNRRPSVDRVPRLAERIHAEMTGP